jgi:hypothetical protein
MSSITVILAVAALLISIGSLGLSAHVAFRDRGRLRITSQFFAANEYGPSHIVTTMVNVGRRPIILRMIGGLAGKSTWSGTYVDHATGGKRLGENERYDHTFSKEDIVSFHPDGEDVVFEELWVEDSLGVRHPIPKSREHIKKLWA